MAKLGEICEILDSKRIPITASERVPGPYPYYGANGVQDYVANYIFDDELILLAEDGGNFGSKDKPIAYRVSGKCWVNNHAHVLKPKAGYDIDYVCYSLMFYDVSNLVNGATRQKLTQADMREMVIPEQPLKEQQHIVAILNRLYGLISLRKQQLAKLDELVKARFVEMFGDPIKNNLELPTKPLGEICLLKAGATTPADVIFDYDAEHTIPCYGGNGIRGYVKESTQYGIYPIIGRQGALCGNVQLAQGGFHATEHAVLLTPRQKMNIFWIFYLLKYMDLYRYHTGAAQPGLAVKTLNTVEVPIADLALQDEFAILIEKINRHKLTIQQSLDKLEVLKKSLMQEYFGGA